MYSIHSHTPLHTLLRIYNLHQERKIKNYSGDSWRTPVLKYKHNRDMKRTEMKVRKRPKKKGVKPKERRKDKWREKVPNRIPLEAERDNLSEEERCHLHCEHTLITPSLPLSHTQSLSLLSHHSLYAPPSLILTSRIHTSLSFTPVYNKPGWKDRTEVNSQAGLCWF